MDNFLKKIKTQLSRRKKEGTLRALSVFKNYKDFASNDYLGLGQKTFSLSEKIPTGATGSRLISGNFPETERLEKRIAEFHEGKEAMLFPSGFQANISLFNSLAKRKDVIFYDAEIHASLKLGIRLSFAEKVPFPHNNLRLLEEKINKIKTSGNKFLVLEALYSMSGDSPDWELLEYLCRKYSLLLILDEAHSGGVFGEGKGLALNHKIRPLITVFTYGKAFGFQGASYVLPEKFLKNYLLNFNLGFIYSTGISPWFVRILQEKYNQISQASREREKLFQNVQYFKEEVTSLPWKVLGEGPIFAILIPDIPKITALEKKLLQQKFFVKKILAPTVPKGTERLRIVLHSYNTKEEIKELISLLKKQN